MYRSQAFSLIPGKWCLPSLVSLRRIEHGGGFDPNGVLLLISFVSILPHAGVETLMLVWKVLELIVQLKPLDVPHHF